MTGLEVLEAIELAHTLIADEATEASLATRGVLALLGRRIRREGVVDSCPSAKASLEAALEGPFDPGVVPPWEGPTQAMVPHGRPVPPIRYLNADGSPRTPGGPRKAAKPERRRALFT